MSWLLSALVGAATGVLSGFGVGGGTLLLMLLGGVPAGVYLADVRPAVSRYGKGSGGGSGRGRW